ncbi:capsule biosynthesis protein CapK [Vibrio qinghaiensis]|uniref:Capsule biosynthesis protein CapK n=1 Tax=Vibrio qinghaiensis TaxID=2025808 RepID=A0A223MW22_9VIBR|nr:phenylacetate--CoA ligase family protein [Vibrio qinghaiensis]ASU21782.1 capsule biosynthesis protein CapK [Vibrio qinghaiensis]
MFLSKIYRKSPLLIQNLLLSCRAIIRKFIRENKHQQSLTRDLLEHDYNKDLLKKYSELQLELALKNAMKAKFYKEKLKTTSESEGLTHFPMINKNEVRHCAEDFINSTEKTAPIKGATSGTTGTPLSISQNMQSVIREQAFFARHLQWAGYKKGDRRAWIRGDMIVPMEQKEAPFWRHSWFENMLMLSSFHMAQQALPLYIKAMVDFGVDIIQAYPSSIATLARYLEANQSYYPAKLKSIITSSESLSAEDRQVIETRFGCKVFDWYGLFERVAAIANCEHGRYHVLTDYSHVEFLDAGNSTHEIVGTNFNNSYFPLVRYKTGDHVVLSDEKQCPCGRFYPIIEHIKGRVGDYLVGEDGQKVHILNHIPKGVTGIIACQFVQSERGQIVVKVVADAEQFNEEQQQKLIGNTQARLGSSLIVTIEMVAALERTGNGKIRQAICTIKDVL